MSKQVEVNKQMEQFLLRGWSLIIIGAILIAIGGIFATLGWNYLQRSSQMGNVIRAIAHELEINTTLVTKEPLFVSEDEEVLSSYRLYPRFKATAINNAIVSGLFNPSKKKHRELLRSLADLEQTIADVNARLDVSDNLTISTKDRSTIAKHRRIVRESMAMETLKSLQKSLDDLLLRDYSRAMGKRFLDKK